MGRPRRGKGDNIETDLKGVRCVLVISGSRRRQWLAPVNTAICHTEGYSFAENIGICFVCVLVNIGTHVADSRVAGCKLYYNRNV